MRLWQDGILALLASIGLSSILWWLIRALFFRPRTLPGALIVICAKGDGAELEQEIRALRLLMRERGAAGRILLTDCGLTEEGKTICRLLARDDRSITLCTVDELETYIT